MLTFRISKMLSKRHLWEGCSSKKPVGAIALNSVPEVFWQASSTRERLWEHHLPALSKFCCPAQSDKEATGTASGVSSQINLLIRLIQQCFNGRGLSPAAKSPVSKENYIFFFLFLSPAALFVYIFKIKGAALDILLHLTLKCSRIYIRMVSHIWA